jgi:hypothetical protein
VDELVVAVGVQRTGNIATNGDYTDYLFKASSGVRYKCQIILTSLTDSVLMMFTATGAGTVNTWVKENDDRADSAGSSQKRGSMFYFEENSPNPDGYVLRAKAYNGQYTGGYKLLVTIA